MYILRVYIRKFCRARVSAHLGPLVLFCHQKAPQKLCLIRGSNHIHLGDKNATNVASVSLPPPPSALLNATKGCANGHPEATPTPSQASAEAAAQEAVNSGGGGQVINLSTGSNETIDAARAASSVSSAGLPNAAVAPSVGSGDGLDGKREAGGVEKGLEGMSARGLVASFRRAQEERVGLYRKFNG